MKKQQVREVWHMSRPQLLMLLCQAMVAFTDVWAAGRIGAETQAAFGLISQLQTVLLVVATAAAGGASSMVGYALREKRMTDARRLVGAILAGGMICSLALAGLGYVYRTGILENMHTPDSMLSTAAVFLSVYLWMLPGQYIVTLGGEIFRAAKSPKLPLAVAAAAMVLNIFGDLAFGLGFWGFPSYGAAGIAWSSLASVGAGAVAILILLNRKGLLTWESRARKDWRKENVPGLIKVTVPAAISSLLINFGNLMLFVVVATLTDSVAVMAGLSAGLRVEALLYLPASVINAAASVMVGNALAANNRQLARTTARRIVLYGCMAMTAVAAILWPFRSALAGFMSADPAAAEQVALFLTFDILGVPFTMISYIVSGVFSGSGSGHYTLLVYDMGIWVVRLPLAWWLGVQRGYGSLGVFSALFIAGVVQALPMLLLLLRDKWIRSSPYPGT